jgi:hypothetical protein
LLCLGWRPNRCQPLWIQAISGLVFFFNSRIKINQQWGLWLIETEQHYSMPDISSIPPNSTVQD